MIFPVGYTSFDGEIVNGVAYFVRPSAPSARLPIGGGTPPLVNGDLWYNPSTGRWAFWRSPFWLSTELNSISLIEQTFVTTTSTTTRSFVLPTNAYLDGLYLGFSRAGSNGGDNTTNYVTASFSCFYGTSNEGGADVLIDSSLAASPYYDSRILINQKYELAWNNPVFSQNVVSYPSTAGGLSFSVSVTEFGASDIRVSAALFWRWRL